MSQSVTDSASLQYLADS